MTVSSTTNKVSYSGNGTNDTFAYTFKIFADADLKVFIRDSSGTETLKTITTHYTVTNAGVSTGGNVVFTSGNIPSATDTVVIQRELSLTQGTDYVENDPFPAQSHEDALDRLTFVTQQIQEEVDRSIKASVTNTISGAEFTVSASDRANKVFAFDGSGDLSVTQELGTFRGNWAASTDYSVRDLVKDTSTNNIFIVNTAHTSSGAQPLTTNANSAKYDLIVDAATATTSATSAAASATTATTQASTATTKAAEAATSATASAASATAAAASETAAAASETASAASETASAASETASAASQTAAAASASSASTSASTATTKASEASASASTATTKASEASASQSAAASSASNAATSESNASTSETNAASSATAAAASAASAAASFDAFDDIYLGAKASAPSVDNDGDALTVGDQYFNTTSNELFIWNGSAFQAASPNVIGDTTPQLGGNLDTNGNDINFGDNDKAVFGADSDMSLFHNGNNAFLDNDTGTLFIQTDALSVKNAAGTESLMLGAADGAVTLYHNNAAKLATTSTGIDVTGTVTADGLTVDASTAVVQASNAGGTTSFEISNTNGVSTANNKAALYLSATGAEANAARIESDFTGTVATNHSQDLNFYYVGGGSSPVLGQKIANNGDISFYADNGTTQGFYWDASTQRLGLGTTGPGAGLEVEDANGIIVSRSGYSQYLQLQPANNSVPTILGVGGNGVHLGPTSTTGIRVNSSGNVGIGKSSSITDKLHIENTGANCLLSVARTDGAAGRLVMQHTSSVGALQTTGSVPLTFGTADTERLRILAGGGLTFNGDTAAANALDDYEEGTFTPSLNPTGGGSISISSSTAKYTKIGNLVFINVFITVGSTSSPTGRLGLSGSPFSATGQPYAAVCHVNGFSSFSGKAGALVEASGTFNIDRYVNGGIAADLANNVGAGDNIFLTATYPVS